jgi:hypothetical protein
MSEITVLFDTKEEPSKEKVDEKLNWYDTIKQEMLVFQGGKLTFRYKEDEYLVKMGEAERQRRGINSTYRMLPEVEDLIVNNHFNMTKNTNRQVVEEWFTISDYDNISVIMTTNDEMIFDVPDDEKKEFCEDLEWQGFKFND